VKIGNWDDNVMRPPECSGLKLSTCRNHMLSEWKYRNLRYYRNSLQMRFSRYSLYLFLIFNWLSGPVSAQQSPLPFATNESHLTIWNGQQYVPFVVKGVNLGVAVPGTFPGELLVSREQYVDWFVRIKAAGFNTIRLYTLHYPQFYAALDSFNRANANNPLYFFQGVWLEEEIPNYDEDLKSIEPYFTLETEENIGCVHGDRVIAQRQGKAWGTYTIDASDWLIGWIIGREIYPGEVLHTNQSYPAETSYTGNYLAIQNTRATEAWMVKQLDRLLTYQQSNYNTMRPVSCSSWPTLDPMHHPFETNRDEDTVTFDISAIDRSKAPAGYFVSYHAYPYYPDFVSQDPEYQGFSDYLGQNSYLGYLTRLKEHYEGIPLIIAEFGVPSSWGIAHYAQSGMHHGGPDEKEQGELNIRLLQNVLQSGCGGGIQFSWMDEWFKRTWLMDPFDYLAERRIIWHNLMSAEQNFGLLGFKKAIREPDLLTTFAPTAAVDKIEAVAEFGLLEIDLFLRQPFRNTDTLYLALDTYVDSLGERVLPTGDTLSHGAEFVLMITNDRADLYVTEAYDLYGIWHNVSSPAQRYRSTATTGAPWKIVRLRNNNGDQEIQYSGRLKSNRADLPPSSKDGVIFDGSNIHIRLPWSLINVVDPSVFRVIHDDRTVAGREDTLSDGLRLSILYRNEQLVTPNRWQYQTWNHALNAAPYEKDSYQIVKNRLPLIPGTLVAKSDTLETNMNQSLELAATTGLLQNDLLLEPGQAFVRQVNAPQFGQLFVQADGSLFYEPQTDFQGIDYFTYELVNGIHRSQPVAVQIRVSDANSRIGFVQLFPNPSDGLCELRAAVPMQRINLFSTTGALLQRWETLASRLELDVRDLPQGLYLLQIQAGDVTVFRKLVIQRP